MSKIMFKNEKYIPAKTLSVGVDIAKWRHCAKATTGNGEYLTGKPFYFENNQDGFTKFLNQAKIWQKHTGCNDVCVGMEPTGPYWKCFNDFLEEKSIKTVLVSPYLARKMKEVYDNSRCKTDSKDANTIARMVGNGMFLTKAKLTEEQESLRHLVERRDVMVKGRTACMNRLGSILAEYFPELEKVFYSMDGKTLLSILKTCPLPCDVLKMGEDRLTKLIRESSHNRLGRSKSLELMNAASVSVGRKRGLDGYRFAAMDMAAELEGLMIRIERVESEIRSYLEKMEEYEYLRTIPCLGEATLSSVISATGDFENYRNVKALLKQLSLQVYENESGSHKGERHISKRGPSLPRSYLYVASVAAVKPGGIYREKFSAMTGRGKAAPVVLTAISCKLVRLMYALVRDKRRYERDYVSGRTVRNDTEPWRKAKRNLLR